MKFPTLLSLIALLGLLIPLGNGMYTISGLSSGAAMAVQFHVAHSSIVNGAGIIAGTPYWCAGLNVINAVVACMSHPELISITELTVATNYAFATGTIDKPSLLSSSKVWLYSGALDSVVNPGVMKKVLSYYETYIPSSSIIAVFNVSSEHAFITNNYGSNCNILGTPYINNCNYDAAGQMLGYLLGKLNPRTTAKPQNVQMLNQKAFIPVVGTDIAAMADNAYVYVPTNCKSIPACRIHVAFHGCEQTTADVGSAFYLHTGYNEWAESNNIVVLYPQAKATVVNPKGCWDWWGYTGADYATKNAVQIATVKNMLDHLSSGGGFNSTTPLYY